MQVPDIHTIVYFILFFMPGFIFMKMYSLFVPTERTDFSKSWQEVVAYSTIFTGGTYLLYIIPKPEWIVGINYLVLFLGLLIAPLFSPFVIMKLQTTRWFHDNMLLLPPTAWDYVFGKREEYSVIVHFKTGNIIGGKYSIDSYTSSYPYSNDIYIEELWELDEDGHFLKSIKQSKGMWIRGDEILGVEFFDIMTIQDGDDKNE